EDAKRQSTNPFMTFIGAEASRGRQDESLHRTQAAYADSRVRAPRPARRCDLHHLAARSSLPEENPMRYPLTILLAVPPILCGFAATGWGAENYPYSPAGHPRGAAGDEPCGLATGVLVGEQKLPAPPLRFRPVAWFGAVKPTDGTSQFLYLLIFK